MENFTFYSPTYFVFGKETELLCGAVIVERKLQMEGKFFIGTDAEVLGQ